MNGMSFNAYGAVLRRVGFAESIERDRAAAVRAARTPRVVPLRAGVEVATADGPTTIIAEPPLAMTLRGC